MNLLSKKGIGLLCCCLFAVVATAQTITLQQCYLLAKQNYPLAKKQDLILKSNYYVLENVAKGFLPRVNINGQATYQSDVTQVPIKIPGMDLPVISKDQYKIYGEATQLLYDGGRINQQKEIARTNSLIDEQSLATDLYQLNDRINQLYFGILLLDEQLKQTDLLKKDIQLGINKVAAALANGTALKRDVNILKVELLSQQQRTVELISNRKAFLEMLSLFINQPLNETTSLLAPVNPSIQSEIKRPELLLFDYQQQRLIAQNKLLKTGNKPKVNLFIQGGFGRPALNMLNNELKLYGIGGVRFSWSLSDFYTLKNEKAQIDISRQNIEVQRATFLFNTNYALKQQHANITKLQELLETDDAIISLRNSIKETAVAQLQNGVINSNDFLREAIAEDLARQNKILHQTQLLMAQYTQLTTSGNLLSN
ncbi:MAG: TolC family protein [Ferruginibacter sp.]